MAEAKGNTAKKDGKGGKGESVAKKVGVKKELTVPEGTMVKCDDGVERPVVSRETALANGVNRYFTGEKCKNGHMVERKCKGYACVTCTRERMKARRKERLATDPDFKAKVAAKRQEKHKARYANDPDYREKVLAKGKARRARKRQEYLDSPEGKKAEAEKAKKKEAADKKKADKKEKAPAKAAKK